MTTAIEDTLGALAVLIIGTALLLVLYLLRHKL